VTGCENIQAACRSRASATGCKSLWIRDATDSAALVARKCDTNMNIRLAVARVRACSEMVHQKR
jgi:hypothetical protein